MDLYSILNTIRFKPHCILPNYATALASKIEDYLAGDMEIPELQKKDPIKNENGIAVIDLNGVIMKRVGLPEEWLEYFGIVDLDVVDNALRKVKDDPSYTSVILNVNSPGGFISGVQSTANLVDELSGVKETVVFTDLLNASAAYWISSQASSIVSTIDAELGSIGVFTTFYDTRKAYEQMGVDVKVFKSGKYKAIGVDGTSLNEEQTQYIQDSIDQSANLFKSTVLKKRNIKEEDLQGQPFNGFEAYNKGFTDGIVSHFNELSTFLTQ